MSITIPTLMRNQKAGRNTHTMATQLICSQMPVIGIHSSSCSADEEKEASNRGDIILKKIPNLNKINDGKRLYYNPNSNEPESPISSKQFLNVVKANAQVMGRLIQVEYGEGFTVDRPIGINDMLTLK